MKVVTNNSITTILDPHNPIVSGLRDLFTFKDKSKEYQISKMMNNPYTRYSPALKELKAGLYQCLLDESVSGQLSFPSGLLELTDLEPDEDHRKDTGKVIPLPWANKDTRELRPYQREAVDKALAKYRGIINIATGMGKSLICLHIVRSVKRNALIIAPSKSIAKQLHDEFAHLFGKNKVGFYGDGKKKKADITIGIAQTVVKHTKDFQDVGLIICDEAHRTASDTFVSILSDLSHVGRIYGLTATAYRSDGKDLLLSAACGPILVQYDAAWGIANGYLAEPAFIIRKIRTNAPDYGDKLMAYKSHVLKAKEISSRIESDARKMMAAGLITLVLVDTIEHGEALSSALGVPFARGDDKSSDLYIKAMNDKKIPGLVATEGKVGEGIDTRTVQCLIMAQFTAAKGAVLQAVGRALRKQDGKDMAYILDYWPVSSNMLSRHASKRVQYYREITSNVKVVE
jgi:superfamily II DNA or RNA helicase